jgi:hypothetical protein
MGTAAFSSPNGFGLGPLLLNGIEIWAVGRKKLDMMPPLFNSGDDISSFVEGGTVQNDNGSLRRYRQESTLHPTEEDIGVDIAVPQFYGEKRE